MPMSTRYHKYDNDDDGDDDGGDDDDEHDAYALVMSAW